MTKCYCSRKYRCAKHQEPIERDLRQAIDVGMRDGTELVIEMTTGFEQFGAYETWEQGWRITGKGIKVEAHYLDEAVTKFVNLLNRKTAGEEIPKWLSFTSPTLQIMEKDVDKIERL